MWKEEKLRESLHKRCCAGGWCCLNLLEGQPGVSINSMEMQAVPRAPGDKQGLYSSQVRERGGLSWSPPSEHAKGGWWHREWEVEAPELVLPQPTLEKSFSDISSL